MGAGADARSAADADEPFVIELGIGQGASDVDAVSTFVGAATAATVGFIEPGGALCIDQTPTETQAPMVALRAAAASIGRQIPGAAGGGPGGRVASATAGGMLLGILLGLTLGTRAATRRGSGSGGGGGRMVVACARRSETGGGGGGGASDGARDSGCTSVASSGASSTS